MQWLAHTDKDGGMSLKRKQLRTLWLNTYVYLVPSVLCVAFIFYVRWGVYGKNPIPWIGDSKGFAEMCKAIVEFSSIVLGIYGFLMPAVICRQDKFNKYFWKNVDKQRFSKDIQRLITSGIVTILLSAGLLISDIFYRKLCEILVGCLCWLLIFFCCNSIRFISIFVSLIVEGQNECDENGPTNNEEHSPEYKSAKRNLDRKLKEF